MKTFKTNLLIKIAYTLVIVMPLLASASARPEFQYEEAKSSKSMKQARGGQGSGGGSIVTVNGRKQLLDLYVNDGFVGTGRYTLPRTKALSLIGVEKINAGRSEVFIEAQARMNRWVANSPLLVERMKQALNSASFYYVNLDFNVLDQNYDLGNKPAPDAIETGALTIQNFGVAVSLRSFEELDSESQVAFLVHESVRYMSIIYGFKISPKALQHLTVLITQGNPRAVFLNSKEVLEEDLYRIVDQDGQADGMKALREFCGILKSSERFVNEKNQTTAAAHELCLQAKNLSVQDITSDMTRDMGKIVAAYEDLVEPRYDLGKSALDLAFNLKKKMIEQAMDLSLATIALNNLKLIAPTAALRDAAVKLNILNVVLDAGISSANDGGKKDEIRGAKALIDSLVGMGLFKR
jgi:hypothetical protein